jgi:hypothetical protein
MVFVDLKLVGLLAMEVELGWASLLAPSLGPPPVHAIESLPSPIKWLKIIVVGGPPTIGAATAAATLSTILARDSRSFVVTLFEQKKRKLGLTTRNNICQTTSEGVVLAPVFPCGVGPIVEYTSNSDLNDQSYN